MEEDRNQQARQGDRKLSPADISPFVKSLCLTYSQLAYYPETHPVTVNQMKGAWGELQKVFGMVGDLTLSIADSKILFIGQSVEEKNTAVVKFSRYFESIQVGSIKFKKSLDYEEFASFFSLFCKDPQTIKDAGGIDALVKSKKITGISFNTTVYKVITEDEKIIGKAEKVGGEAKPRKPRTKTLQPIAERIQQKLDSEFKDIHDKDRTRLVEYLNNVYVREIKKIEEKNEDLADEISEIREVIQNIEEVFDETNLGFILIDRKQKVCFVEHGHKIPFDLMLNEPLPEPLVEQLSGFKDTEPFKIDDVNIMQVTRDPRKRIKAILFQYE
ncbi:MAG TPA: hypothetical protein DET40_16300 [Lentisphaeria bacterium]|nr:MAG: hypothetical protein A2X45_22680 [Lentisphaerae bacterium GWF2_50_93]HCE45103.1 hypothetical protein [Lentisphaeria bacterium]